MKIQIEVIENREEQNLEWCSWIQGEADPSSTVFLDIETTGFSRRYDSIYLIGLMYLQEGKMVVEQYLAASPSDEPELLRAVCLRLQAFKTIVTFNGNAFDLPFIRERIRAMKINEVFPELQSLDLYKEYRSAAPLFQWDSCRLKEIEKNLGMRREDEKSGGELIDVFYEYSIAQDPLLEKELLLHNFEDVLDLSSLLCIHGLFRMLKEMDYSGFHLSEKSESGKVCIEVQMNHTFPMTASWTYALCRKYPMQEPVNCMVERGDSKVIFLIPFEKMKMKYYLPDHQDYYILEDGTLMHKSLGNPPVRRKASPQECFLEKEDCYFPCSDKKKALSKVHLFQVGYEDKMRFYSLSEVRKRLGNCMEEEQRNWLISFLPDLFRKSK